MTSEIPGYALRAYALLYGKYGSFQPFTQSFLDWITSSSMKKKIFAVLLKSGWISKKSREEYLCIAPEKAISGLLDFKVPSIMKETVKPYAFTQLSAVEIWSDYAYVQRGIERSPYFLKIETKDLRYWKDFFSRHSIPHYFKKGSTIGEFVILLPQKKVLFVEKEGMNVEPLAKALSFTKKNEMFAYPYQYMRKKYGSVAERKSHP